MPKVDVTVSGGACTNVYRSTAPDAIWDGVGLNCSFPLRASFTRSISGSTLNVSFPPSSGGLAPSRVLFGSGFSGTITLIRCTGPGANCNGNPIFPQNWLLSRIVRTINSEPMTTAYPWAPDQRRGHDAARAAEQPGL